MAATAPYLRTAFIRTLAVFPFWIIRAQYQGAELHVPKPGTLALDLVLLGGHWWAALPAADAEAEFPTRARPSFLLMIGIAVAGAITFRDATLFVRGIPL